MQRHRQPSASAAVARARPLALDQLTAAAAVEFKATAAENFADSELVYTRSAVSAASIRGAAQRALRHSFLGSDGGRVPASERLSRSPGSVVCCRCRSTVGRRKSDVEANRWRRRDFTSRGKARRTALVR
jgi:hypothetical protein